ncbi:MAG: cell division protein FtsH [Rickettsiales bacterium]|nr:cell division protein FtsH [Rickettsiales bacterium]|tara:strand:+ start:8626 stop:10530 length:1905 start_codon:yes stop_codon:yes gene_type:complete
MKKNQNFIYFLLLIGVLVIALAASENFNAPVKKNDVTYTEFKQMVDAKQVSEVSMRGNVVTGKTTNGQNFTTRIPYNSEVGTALADKGVQVKAEPIQDEGGSIWQILLSYLPTVIFIGFLIYAFSQMQGGAKGMGFGRSKAKLMNESKKKVTFKDVAGAEEAKEEVGEIVEFLKDPQKFQRLGGRIPAGVLMVGPPGTGKTLLARAIAGEAKVPFFSISGSDFIEMFVGVGASRVRSMFEQAKKSAPCIIFIDEIDAVGRQRGSGGFSGGHDEREQTLNQLLVEMDGFNDNEGVIVIAATNRADVLDKALLRPGRFDRQVTVGLPDIDGREAILNVHLEKVPTADDVNTLTLARGTPGFSGADLANIVNEAALLAARRGRRVVGMAELDAARDKVAMGPEKKSKAMTDKEKKLVAYHEGGHALVGFFLPVKGTVNRATIIPRTSGVGGFVETLPENERHPATKADLEGRIALSMGGRVAEELIFGKENATTGAQSDFRQATSIAQYMVVEFGMSDVLGPLNYTNYGLLDSDSIQNLSPETTALINSEVRKIVINGYNKAREILEKHIDKLHLFAEKLIEYETLMADEIKSLLTEGTIHREPTTRTRRKRSSSIDGLLKSETDKKNVGPEPKPSV